jgi:Protein of unknown function (DUF3024)
VNPIVQRARSGRGGSSYSLRNRTAFVRNANGSLCTQKVRTLADSRGDGTWNLYFGDRYGKWTEYLDLDTNQPISVILDEIGLDPTGVFWG